MDCTDVRGRWPWPRDVHAKLHERIAAGKPKVVANITFFSEPERDRGLTYIAITDHSQRVSMARGLNPERVLLGAEATGLGRVAIQRAAKYARERVVFGNPIGSYQLIQGLITDMVVETDAARMLTYHSAWLAVSRSSISCCPLARPTPPIDAP